MSYGKMINTIWVINFKGVINGIFYGVCRFRKIIKGITLGIKLVTDDFYTEPMAISYVSEQLLAIKLYFHVKFT